MTLAETPLPVLVLAVVGAVGGAVGLWLYVRSRRRDALTGRVGYYLDRQGRKTWGPIPKSARREHRLLPIEGFTEEELRAHLGSVLPSWTINDLDKAERVRRHAVAGHRNGSWGHEEGP